MAISIIYVYLKEESKQQPQPVALEAGWRKHDNVMSVNRGGLTGARHVGINLTIIGHVKWV